MTTEKLNLKGRKERLLYYRFKETNEEQIIERIRNGKDASYIKKMEERVYYEEEYVRKFSLEKFGQPLPRVHGHFTPLDNYFLDYWGHVLGSEATTVFAHLLRYCYGDKDYCFPNVDLIALKMNKTKQSIRKYLDCLEEHGFIMRFWVQNPLNNKKNESPIFKIRKTIPFLSQELIETLPLRLKEEHDRYVANLMESYEIQINEKDDYDEIIAQVYEQGALPERPKQLSILNKEYNYQKKRELLLNLRSEEDIKLWNYVFQRLSETVSKPSLDTWFNETFCLTQKNEIRIYTVNSFYREWINSRYQQLIADLILQYGSRNYEKIEVLCIKEDEE